MNPGIYPDSFSLQSDDDVEGSTNSINIYLINIKPKMKVQFVLLCTIDLNLYFFHLMRDK